MPESKSDSAPSTKSLDEQVCDWWLKQNSRTGESYSSTELHRIITSSQAAGTESIRARLQEAIGGEWSGAPTMDELLDVVKSRADRTSMAELRAQIEADQKERWKQAGIHTPLKGRELARAVEQAKGGTLPSLYDLSQRFVEDLEDQRILGLIDALAKPSPERQEEKDEK